MPLEPASTRGPGRPRSTASRRAILHAVDDILVEIGYSAMTVKGIAERAGVGRQTIYRWWSTKAEILMEACTEDASAELGVSSSLGDPREALTEFVEAATVFLTESPSGKAYLALLGEAQHDAEVRALLAREDPLARPTTIVVDQVLHAAARPVDAALAHDQLLGPMLSRIMVTGRPLTPVERAEHARSLLRTWGVPQGAEPTARSLADDDSLTTGTSDR